MWVGYKKYHMLTMRSERLERLDDAFKRAKEDDEIVDLSLSLCVVKKEIIENMRDQRRKDREEVSHLAGRVMDLIAQRDWYKEKYAELKAKAEGW